MVDIYPPVIFERAYELRLQGLTYMKIAEVLVSEGWVSDVAVDVVASGVSDRANGVRFLAVEQRRAVEEDRLDRYLTKLEPAVERGDVKAIAEARRISESRRKLLGLDAPQQVVTTTVLVDAMAIDQELTQLAMELGIAPPLQVECSIREEDAVE